MTPLPNFVSPMDSVVTPTYWWIARIVGVFCYRLPLIQPGARSASTNFTRCPKLRFGFNKTCANTANRRGDLVDSYTMDPSITDTCICCRPSNRHLYKCDSPSVAVRQCAFCLVHSYFLECNTSLKEGTVSKLFTRYSSMSSTRK